MHEVLAREIDINGVRRTLGAVLVELQSAGSWRSLADVVRGLPAGDALEALDALATGRVPGAPERLGIDYLVKQTSLELADRIDATQGACAAALLDRWSASKDEMPAALACWAFIALARASMPCVPSWERLFPFVRVGGPRDASVPRVKEAARALPPSRVLEVTKAAMERGPVAAPYTALCVLHAHDDEALARHLLAYRSAAWTRERIVQALERLGDRPGIQRALGSVVAPALVLRVESRVVPTSLDGLDAIRREQLRIAGDRLDGKARSATERLAASGDDSEGGICEHRVLTDDSGRARYDAWLFGVDSGTYFEADSSRIVAERIQGGVTGAERALADALDAASGPMDEGPAKKR